MAFSDWVAEVGGDLGNIFKDGIGNILDKELDEIAGGSDPAQTHAKQSPDAPLVQSGRPANVHGIVISQGMIVAVAVGALVLAAVVVYARR